jgi:hypothetical protein
MCSGRQTSGAIDSFTSRYWAFHHGLWSTLKRRVIFFLGKVGHLSIWGIWAMHVNDGMGYV